MKEVKIVVWCDACAHAEHTSKAEAALSWQVTISDEGVDAKPRVLDLCLEHSESLVAPLVWLLKDARPVEHAPKPQAQLGRVAPDGTCPLCNATMRRSSLITHVWSKHRKEERPRPTHCPECGYVAASPAGVGMHRALKHGWDAVEDALLGVPEYVQMKGLAS